MAYLFEYFYPFDGMCSNSFGGDVELRFPDGSSLFAHSILLTVGSPALQKRLRLDGVTLLEMSESRKEVWQIILNCLYPSSGFNLRAGRERLIDDPLTNEVLQECAKFQLQRVASLYDAALWSLVQRGDDRAQYALHSDDEDAMHIDETARKSVSYVTQFPLHDTLHAAKQLNRAQLIKSIERQLTPKKERPRFTAHLSLSPKTPKKPLRTPTNSPMTPSKFMVDRIQCPCCTEIFEHLRRS